MSSSCCKTNVTTESECCKSGCGETNPKEGCCKTKCKTDDGRECYCCCCKTSASQCCKDGKECTDCCIGIKQTPDGPKCICKC